MPPQLIPTPSSLNLGSVVVGRSSGASIIFFNSPPGIGGAPITVTAITLDELVDFSLNSLPPLPLVVNPGDAFSVGVSFTPSALGNFSGFVEVDSDATNDPVQVLVSGTGVANAAVLAANPSQLAYGSVKAGVASPPMDVILQSTGTVVVNVSGFVLDPQVVCTNPPVFPFAILPGNSAGPFHFTVTPVAIGFLDIPHGIKWNSDAADDPVYVDVNFLAVAIFPKYVLTGSVVKLLLSFVLGGNPLTKAADGTDLNCEEPGFFSRIHDFGAPGFEKTINRLLFRYENLGKANVTGTFNSTRSGASKSDTKAVGSVGADGLIYDSYIDAVLAHDLLQLVISRNANDGPLSLTEFEAKVTVKGEYAEGSG